MHTQHDTAQVIIGRQADYVMTVKSNMPTLYRQLKKLPWPPSPPYRPYGRHGRRARRTMKAVLRRPIGSPAPPSRAARRTSREPETVEVVYLITSDRDADRHPAACPRPLR